MIYIINNIPTNSMTTERMKKTFNRVSRTDDFSYIKTLDGEIILSTLFKILLFPSFLPNFRGF